MAEGYSMTVAAVVADGLALLADRLLGAGFDEGDVREMIVLQSRRLAGAT